MARPGKDERGLFSSDKGALEIKRERDWSYPTIPTLMKKHFFLPLHQLPLNMQRDLKPLPCGCKLIDDFVHESRARFSVPRFHELNPGGYEYPRVFFAGNDKPDTNYAQSA